MTQNGTMMEAEEVDLFRLINKIVSGIAPPTFKIAFTCSAASCRIVTFAEKLKQVLFQLVHNAIRFNDQPESGVVEIECSDKDRFLLFQVKDNGKGIPDEIGNRLFQTGLNGTLPGSGTAPGSGLHIAKNIVSNAGGEIGYRKSESFGTVFWFTWPSEVKL